MPQSIVALYSICGKTRGVSNVFLTKPVGGQWKLGGGLKTPEGGWVKPPPPTNRTLL